MSDESMLHPAMTLSISIAVPPAAVYAFVTDPLRLPLWANGLGNRPTPLPDGAWRVETSAGPMRVSFAPPNPFGVVDHQVTPLAGGGTAVDVPLRVVPNGPGSEVLLTLFRQPEMSDEQYAADAALVRTDLERLKSVLEHIAPPQAESVMTLETQNFPPGSEMAVLQAFLAVGAVSPASARTLAELGLSDAAGAGTMLKRGLLRATEHTSDRLYVSLSDAAANDVPLAHTTEPFEEAVAFIAVARPLR